MVLMFGVLQAVGAADGELELVHRAEQVLVELLLLDRLHLLGGLLGLVEVDEDRELLLDDLGGVGDRVVRRDRAVGPDLERELVVVGLLPDAGVRDLVVHLADRAEERVDRDRADGLPGHLVPLGRDVAAAAPRRQLHPDPAALADREDVVARVQDLDLPVGDDVAGLDLAGPVRLDPDRLHLVGVDLEEDLLEVQDDVGDVLGDLGDGHELVLDPLDLHRGDRGALQRREQHAPQRVAEGDAEAALERLRDELAVGVGEGLLVDRQPAGLDEVAPVLRDERIDCHGAVLLGRRPLSPVAQPCGGGIRGTRDP